MVEFGLAGKAGRRKVRTTVRDPKAELAPDLVKRDFAGIRRISCGSGT
jgi:hypothetical protein